MAIRAKQLHQRSPWRTRGKPAARVCDHLAGIATKEGINADPEALHLIAQKADGALRDALSIFDQIVTFTGNELTYKSVIENLNILDYDYYFKISE